ncbi:putative trans-sialidase, Group VIII [Trypanosoma cruzi]|uniref:Trans-sialidase, putative n=2 Tax=Trypanosoma cruzi TaxID=5693 RepID=Q4E3C3_TRYCC|nr:trans-sialidase, putative [Trypanosoma cruzi]EAN99251.1 trans-sialidase, putative [Trypanosoma cruzi]PWV19569.1 putative trans-sialidase, Group VIII [Trypanosoma cruzi]|eukprot:XP_821102.1 trans-sialidase [Trypanosoma cruzi strain CL Brener]
MSRHLFYSAVLPLLVVLCGSGAAHTVQTKTAVDPFTGIGWTSSQWEAPTKVNETLFSLRVPSLVEVNNNVFFVAEALCKEKGESRSRTGIASRHLDLTDDKPKEILTEDTSLVVQFPEGVATGTVEAKDTMRPTTVVSGDSVYMLLRNQGVTPLVGKSANARDWGLLLVKGSVSGGNGITWNETHAVTFENNEYAAKFLTQLVSGGGSGIKTKDGTLMFPMQATKNENTSLLSMRFDKSENKWKLSHQTDVDGCRDPTIVEWGDDRFLMMASCERGYRDVYGSTESGRSWFPYGETLTRVWGNSHDRKGHGVQNAFIKVTIEDKDVMLVTLPVYPKEDNKQKGRLHLWVTDNSRVYDVGPISREDDDAAASSLLMKSGNEKLISLYENKKGDDGSYSLVALSLREQLERIKSVVKTWSALDGALKTCHSGSSATVDPRKKGMCAGPVPTKGLVGFLSGNFSDNKWRDEYLCVNATVNNGEPRVRNGLTFKGPGAGAVWPVGKMGQTVPYYFANNKFTLVATVSIHEAPKEASSPIPLMGVIMKDNSSTALFGLSYTHEKKWRFTLPNGTYGGVEDDEDDEDYEGAEDDEDDEVAEDYEDYEYYEHDQYYEGKYNWQPNKTYQVMLQMNTKEWYVYVDRMRVYSGHYNWDLFKDHRVSHIYFGAENKEGSESSHVTVSNVLLYNRIIYGRGRKMLNASKVSIPNPGEEFLTEKEEETPSSPEEGKAEQEVGEALPRPQSSVEAPEGSDAAAVSSGIRGSHGKREEETETDGSGELASPPALSSVGTSAHSGDDGMGVREGTTLQEEVPPPLGTEDIPKADVERPIYEEEATSPEWATERQTQETTAPLVENGDGEDVGTASGNASTLPGETEIPSESNATSLSDHGILPEHGHYSELAGMALFAESTVHGCVSRVLLLLLLGLWGTAALC